MTTPTSPAGALSAIVVNWRTPNLTVRCVRALVAAGVEMSRIAIVDDGSGDGSAETLAAALPGGVHVPLDDNVGFARASNAGARALPAEHAYLFVNSDAFAHGAGAVAWMLAAFDDPRVGLAVPRLLNPDLTLQPSVVPFAAPLPALVRASGLSRWVPNRWQPRLATHWDHGRSRAIQSATGAVLAVRATTWHQLGGFDERRFMYVEDHDLFRRTHALGWTARFAADATFVHLGGASAQRRWSDAERARRVARAEATMLDEHLGPIAGRFTLATMAAGAGGRALVHRVRGDRAAAHVQEAWMRGYLRR